MQVAVVTGEHGFQEKQFDAVFESMEGVQFVREDLDEFVDDPRQNNYDTVVFYNFHRPYSDGGTSAGDSRYNGTGTGHGHSASRHLSVSRLGCLFRDVRYP